MLTLSLAPRADWTAGPASNAAAAPCLMKSRRGRWLTIALDSITDVGQDGILRPIVNRLSWRVYYTARSPINNRPQDAIPAPRLCYPFAHGTKERDRFSTGIVEPV